MKKHLKLRGRLTKSLLGKTCVAVKVLEQTHRGNDFGDNVGGNTHCFRYKDVTLASAVHTGFYVSTDSFSGFRAKYTIRVRGESGYNDNIELVVPLKAWPDIKEAVEAYNRYFGG